MNTEEKYMMRCLELAQKGAGNVAPNPLVGSVIVHDDKIIGEGYHSIYGGPHAEVMAIHSVINKELLRKSTIYVNLEPCAHHGKTPPCSDLIIDMEIPHVVIGAVDSFSEVNGRGIERLKKAGITVEIGILEKNCRELNKRFFTFHEKKQPYVVLKWAQTLDGFIDRKRVKEAKGINWISAPETRLLVHQWRSQEMGILVGRTTVENDSPLLNVRDVNGKDPIRIVIDPNLKVTHQSFPQKTLILNRLKSCNEQNLQFIQPKSFEIEDILTCLWEQNIQSILVEGGASTLQRFIDSNLWNETRIITGQTHFSEGLCAPVLNNHFKKKTNGNYLFGSDLVQEYVNKHD